MKINKLLSKIVPTTLCVVILTGCTGSNNNTTPNQASSQTTVISNEITSNTSANTSKENSSTEVTTVATQVTPGNRVDVSYDSDDYTVDWKSQSHETITLSDKGNTVTGLGASVDGDVVTISSSGIYEVTGTLNEGSIVIDVDKNVDKGTVYLILNNAHITSQVTAPINILEGKKVVLVLEEGTENTVAQGSNIAVDESNNPSAAIFSKADLTITGDGVLNVSTAYNDGITSKDDLKITGGILAIDAAGDGLVGKDLLAVENGKITITAGKDGIRSTNDTDEGKGNIIINGGEFKVVSANDGLQAEGILQLHDGTFDITTGGGYSDATAKTGGMSDKMGGRGQMPAPTTQTLTTTMETESQKGLKAASQIIIDGGIYRVSSAEDTIHSNGGVIINNGQFSLTSGDDGIHADGDVEINNGEIDITKSYEGIEGSNITINGGNISLESSDDGINMSESQGLLTFNEGYVYVNANGDGLDSNDSIKMMGGTVIIEGSTSSGNAALDYDNDFSIEGGVLIAAGSSGMAQTPREQSSQATVMMYYSNMQNSGTSISLKDSSGNVVIDFTASKEYQSICISSPQLEVGESYTLYSNENEVVEVTLSSIITYLTESGVTTGMQGGFGGGNRPSGNTGAKVPNAKGQVKQKP